MSPLLRDDPRKWEKKFRKEVAPLLASQAPQLVVPVKSKNMRQMPEFVVVAQRVMWEHGYRLVSTVPQQDHMRGVWAYATSERSL